MKKLRQSQFYELSSSVHQHLRIMRLTLLIVLLSVSSIFANRSYSQESLVNIHLRSVSLNKVLSEIEKQSSFRFFYNRDQINTERIVDVSASKVKISEVLKKLFAGSDVAYELIDNHIVLVSKKKIITETSDAKEIVVTGTVKDKSNALPGVVVMLKGAKTGTITDLDGHFSITVPSADATLVFTFIGYKPQEVQLQGRKTIEVVMEEDSKNLEEVVVIGYGTQKKADVTSSVSSVKTESFNKGSVQDAGQLIQGKVAGLAVTLPSGDPTASTQIALRGSTTLLGTSVNPLILIDGVPGDFKTVAPQDIESIDVLKDGSAAAIYGTRGTNGVILITTKKASGDYTSTVEYSGYMSTQSIAKKLDLLTAEDYRQQIAAGTRSAADDLGSSTDWMKEITRTPFNHVHNITFRGGNKKTNFLANVNYESLQGIFKKSDNQTFTGRVDFNHFMFDDKVKINVNILSSQNKYTSTSDGGSYNGYTYRQAIIRNPTAPIKNEDGSWNENVGAFNYDNPLARLYESDGVNAAQTSRFNSNITYTPVKDLKISSLISYSKWNQTRGYYETKNNISTLRGGKNGYASNGAAQSIDRLAELTIDYSKQLGDHNVKLLAGYSYSENSYKNFWMQNWDFPTDRFSYNNIGTGLALQRGEVPVASSASETNLIGFFGRLSYNYNDRYLFLASLRKEEASQLYGTKNPWGLFPSVSLGWRITKEAFMKNQHLFDDIKLRAGYGVTGTQPSTPFLAVAMLGYDSNIMYNGTWIKGLSPTRNQNEYLKWEEKQETNIGADFSLLGGRISGNVDYYNRHIKNLLFSYGVPVPPNLVPTTTANAAEMENKGLEFAISVIPVKKKDFEWTSSVNFSTNKNKLLTLSNDLYQASSDYFTSGNTGEPISTFTHLTRVGGSIGDFYGFKVIGLGDDGRWIYEDKDGNAVPEKSFAKTFENKKVIGNGLPKYYAGWNNTFRYKNFDLSISMRGAFKFQILNYQRMYYENPNTAIYNKLRSSMDKVFGKSTLKSTDLEFNSYYIEDGDYWKIDNITLGYNLPKTGIKFIQSARIYVSSLNTMTITGYKGIDPEVGLSGLAPGIDDRDKYPTTRTFTCGINLKF